MTDYGLKVAKQGQDLSNNLSDLTMSARYPFAKIDQTVENSFITVTISFLSTPTVGSETIIHTFNHDYDYTPQAWGLWNISYIPSITFIQYTQAYGHYTSASGFGAPRFNLDYYVNDTTVSIGITPFNGIPDPISMVGVTAKLTMYIFSEDLSAQDYTVD